MRRGDDSDKKSGVLPFFLPPKTINCGHFGGKFWPTYVVDEGAGSNPGPFFSIAPIDGAKAVIVRKVFNMAQMDGMHWLVLLFGAVLAGILGRIRI